MRERGLGECGGTSYEVPVVGDVGVVPDADDGG